MSRTNQQIYGDFQIVKFKFVNIYVNLKQQTTISCRHRNCVGSLI